MVFSCRKREVLATSLFMLLILDGIAGTTVIVQDDSHRQDFRVQTGSNNRNVNRMRKNNSSFIKFEVDDSSYPYDKLLEIVKETRKLLTSKNNTEVRKILNFDPTHYDTYLTNYGYDVSTPPVSITYPRPVYAGVPFASYGCDVEVRITYPKKMKGIDGKDYYILNVGDEFIQRVETTICRKSGARCGNPITWQENRRHICRQSYTISRHLFSIPVKEELGLADQRVKKFKIPNECVCKRVILY